MQLFSISRTTGITDVFKQLIVETARIFKAHGRQIGPLFVDPAELLNFCYACDEVEYRVLGELNQFLAEMINRRTETCKNVITALESKVMAYETEMICLMSSVFIALDVGDVKKLGQIHVDTPSLSYDMKVRMDKLIECPYRLIRNPDVSEHLNRLALLQRINEKLNADEFDGAISKMYEEHVNRLADVSNSIHECT